MKNPELYKKTVDILVAAYFNDTLEHGNCYACAVGNIIAGNCGYGFIKMEKNDVVAPLFNVYTGCGKLYWDRDNDINNNPLQKMTGGHFMELATTKQWEFIRKTGYSGGELARIEHAFESAPGEEEYSDEWMFNGLMAVIEVLDQIHENKDEATTKESKDKFKKVPAQVV